MILTDIDSEQLVLGTLLSGAADLPSWMPYLNMDCFTDATCRSVFRAIEDLLNNNEHVSISTLTEQLRIFYPTANVSEVNLMALSTYSQPDCMRKAVKVLQDFSARRRLILLGEYLKARASDYLNTPVTQIVDYVQASLDTLDASPMECGKSLEEVGPELRQRMEDNLSPKTRHQGPLTGIQQLDEEANLPESGLVVLGGYTSHGKSAFALKMALLNARLGRPLAIFSKEMTNLESLSRMVSMGTSGISASAIMTRPLSAEQHSEALSTLQLLQEQCGRQVWLDDSRSLRLDDVTAAIRRLHKRHGIRVAFVDYLQLLTHDALMLRNTNQEQLMAHYSRVLKNLGDQLNICIVALSQLNRSMSNQRPSVATIRDSGQIAEAADYVMFVWRPGVNRLPYDEEYALCPTDSTALLIVGKNRQGPTTDVLMGWSGTTTRFYELSRAQIDEMKSGSTDPRRPKFLQMPKTANP